MSCFCDYDAPEFYNRYSPTARKAHACYECRGVIAAGEKYEYVSGMWDGRFDVFKTCIRCVHLRTWVKNNVPCLCWAHGNLWEDLFNTVEDAQRRAGSEAPGLLFGFYRRRELISRHNRALKVAA
jgi:hypothetical protein